jgi:hypothetical protein
MGPLLQSQPGPNRSGLSLVRQPEDKPSAANPHFTREKCRCLARSLRPFISFVNEQRCVSSCSCHPSFLESVKPHPNSQPLSSENTGSCDRRVPRVGEINTRSRFFDDYRRLWAKSHRSEIFIFVENIRRMSYSGRSGPIETVVSSAGR